MDYLRLNDPSAPAASGTLSGASTTASNGFLSSSCASSIFREQKLQGFVTLRHDLRQYRKNSDPHIMER